MYTNFGTALAVLATQIAFTAADELKIGLISDLHLHLRYNPNWSVYDDTTKEGDCMVNGG